MKKYGFIMIMCFFVFVSFLSKVNAFINGYELLGKVIFLDAGHPSYLFPNVWYNK